MKRNIFYHLLIKRIQKNRYLGRVSYERQRVYFVLINNKLIAKIKTCNYRMKIGACKYMKQILVEHMGEKNIVSDILLSSINI